MAAHPGYLWEAMYSEEDATESSVLFLRCTICSSEFTKTDCEHLPVCHPLHSSAISDTKNVRIS